VQVADAAHHAFVTAMSLGLRMAAAVALASAVAAVFALPRHRQPDLAVPDADAVGTAESAGAEQPTAASQPGERAADLVRVG